MDPVLAPPARRAAPLRALVIATASLASLGGCQPHAVAEAPAARPAIAAGTGEEYRIDPAASEIHVLVYRAGPLSRLGHNHVVAVGGPEGRVLRRERLTGSRVELLISVEDLEVDPAALRERYGEPFASMPSEADVAGTRENMLGPALLDARAYPHIRVAGTLLSAGNEPRLGLEIAVKDTVVERSVPISLEVGDDSLTARGMLELSHAELGLTPFSIMLGVLRVAETMEIRFSVTARRSTGAS